MFIFGLIIGLIIGGAGGVWITWRLSVSKKVKKVVEIVLGPGTSREKIKKIAEIFGVTI